MSAPYITLYYEDNFNGDLVSQDILVPASGLAANTYYCAVGWNTGQEGAGYCGIQNTSRGRNFIFSLWDPKATRTPIKATYVGQGSEISKFGNEGTGLKSLNFQFGWKTDHWYTLTVRRYDQNNHTFFDCWATEKSTKRSAKLVTMEYPVPHVYFHGPSYSFLEDFLHSGGLTRSVMYGHGTKRGLDGHWDHHARGRLYRDATKAGVYKNAFNFEVRSGSYYVQSGNGTVPRNGAHDGMELVLHKKREDDCMDVATPFQISLHASPKEVTWDIPESFGPQFRYTITVDGIATFSEVDAETRKHTLNTPAKISITLEIEDLFGNVASRNHCFRHE